MADNLNFALSKSKMFAFKMSLRTPGTLLKKNYFYFFSWILVFPSSNLENILPNHQVNPNAGI